MGIPKQVILAGLVLYAGYLARVAVRGYRTRRIFHRLRQQGMVSSGLPRLDVSPFL